MAATVTVENRPPPATRRWFNRAVEAGAVSEDVEALRRIEAAQESDVVEQALLAARERLHMDAAYVTTMDSRQQTIEALVGETNAPVAAGVVIPIEQTYCARMLNDEIPNIVANTRSQPAIRDLRANRYIGAYVGVPVRLSDGRVHGSLCCVSNEPCEGLGEAELRFMRVLAGIVAARVEQAQGNLARLTVRLRTKAEAPDPL
jgi:GAF domain-containing protein